jgi:hypothetical protein
MICKAGCCNLFSKDAEDGLGIIVRFEARNERICG